MTYSYAGIGSRDTPGEILELMESLGCRLANLGFILNTGGAQGADSAFLKGHLTAPRGEYSQVFIPWRGFNNVDGIVASDLPEYPEAEKIVSGIHPAWGRCSQGARKLHARNAFQILGKDLKTPVSFVICWTRNGKPIGGTRTAIVLAEAQGIPVYNLANSEDCFLIRERFLE